jgi:large subunit ribosomal protein L17
MRHRKSGRKLKRTASHRKALLSALSTSLLRHKRITTTLAKAQEARAVVEKIITKSRHALASAEGTDRSTKAGKFVGSSGPARREIARVIKDKGIVAELFSTIAPRVGARPGGYTRIVKLGRRKGDGAELAILELVDFQAGQEKEEKPAMPEKRKSSKKGSFGSRKKVKAAASSDASGEQKAASKSS